MKQKLLNIKELAEMLSVSKYTIYDWACRRKIPYIKFGHIIRFDLVEIKKWLKEKEKEPYEEKITLYRRIDKKLGLYKRGNVWYIDVSTPHGHQVRRAVSTSKKEAKTIGKRVIKAFKRINSRRWETLIQENPDFLDAVTFGGKTIDTELNKELFKERERINLIKS